MKEKSFQIILGTLLFLSPAVAQWDFDMATIQILRPVDTVHLNDSLYPKARIKNVGNFPVWPDFDVVFTIENFYSDTTTVTTRIEAGQEAIVYFRRWGVGSLGTFEVKCSTAYGLDQNTSNDKLTDTIFVVPPPISYWQKLTEVIPTSPDGKMIKRGGCLTATNTEIFIIKGNRTKSFYCYIPGSQPTWIDDVPILEKKGIKKGCAMVFDGMRYLYIALGTNTLQFLRYDTQDSTWTDLKLIPEGPSGKALKGGTGIAYVDSFVYLLKGSKTTEFYRYNVILDNWEKRKDGPTTYDPSKGYRDGSCLVSDGYYIYALRGKYNEFFKYYPTNDSWSKLKELPFVHPMVKRSKKVGDGAAMTFKDGNIYALKGKNTKEFWMYDLLLEDWIFKDTIPKGTEKKYVKAGGGICNFNGTIYMIKGNKRNVIYKYLGSDKAAIMQTEINNTRPIRLKVKEDRVLVKPNPTTNSANLHFNLQFKDITTVKVYNISGKLVRNEKVNHGFIKDLKLLPGIYILRFESAANRFIAQEKLVILE